MSKIGRKKIAIPQDVNVSVVKGNVIVKGKMGELSILLPHGLACEIEDGFVSVIIKSSNSRLSAMQGLARSLINNAVTGVSSGFEKKLILNGVGFKAEIKGNKLELNVGYSHPVLLEIPESLQLNVEKDRISVSGIDKQKVGQFSAKIRAVRKPEPYKGTGIKYEDEIIARKQGKTAKGEEGE